MDDKYHSNGWLKYQDAKDERMYLKVLIYKAFEQKLIDLNFIEVLNDQLTILINKRTECFKNNANYSKEQEKICNSICYVIGIYLKNFELEEAIEEIKKNTIADLYLKGRRVIERKLNVNQIIYLKVVNNKLKINGQVYNNVINYELKNFFKKYNLDNDALDIKVKLDYPLHNEYKDTFEGIEFVEKYMNGLYYENEFCNMFDALRLKAISNYYEIFNINLFQVVFSMAIGCVLAEKNVKELKIESEDLDTIYKKFDVLKSKDSIYSLVYDAYNKLRVVYFPDNSGMQKYIESNIGIIQNQIYSSYVIKKLDKILCI